MRTKTYKTLHEGDATTLAKGIYHAYSMIVAHLDLNEKRKERIGNYVIYNKTNKHTSNPSNNTRLFTQYVYKSYLNTAAVATGVSMLSLSIYYSIGFLIRNGIHP